MLAAQEEFMVGMKSLPASNTRGGLVVGTVESEVKLADLHAENGGMQSNFAPSLEEVEGLVSV